MSITILPVTSTVKFPLSYHTKPTKHHINTTPTKFSMIKSSTTTNLSTNISIPTMEDIMESSKSQKLDVKLQKIGPFFRITATSFDTKSELGRAEGVIRAWLNGKILHLDSIRLRRETLSIEKSIFGVGLYLGAVAVRYGFDSGCHIAQLLAINDSDLYHDKLVRFYSRMGFRAVHEVDGSSIGDLSHMLVWGGKGTRMDANIQDLLIKWGKKFKPKT